MKPEEVTAYNTDTDDRLDAIQTALDDARRAWRDPAGGGHVDRAALIAALGQIERIAKLQADTMPNNVT